MKKFTNKSNQLRTVYFADGSAQFLMRGQSITSDKEYASVQEGIKVSDAVVSAVSKKTTKKAEETVGSVGSDE